MKTTIEFTDTFAAKLALQAPDYLQFVEDFENYLESLDFRENKDRLLDKFNSLKGLYKI
jgi:hypothetical protein